MNFIRKICRAVTGEDLPAVPHRNPAFGWKAFSHSSPTISPFYCRAGTVEERDLPAVVPAQPAPHTVLGWKVFDHSIPTIVPLLVGRERLRNETLTCRFSASLRVPPSSRYNPHRIGVKVYDHSRPTINQ